MSRRINLCGRGPSGSDGVLGMPSFHYRALTQNGEVVSGSLAASTADDVLSRIEYLRLVPLEAPRQERTRRKLSIGLTFSQKARSEAVTIFTLDLALLLKAGARLDDALQLLSTDSDVGGLRPTIAAIRTSVLSGESFAEAVGQHTDLFAPMYVALVRVGETSGTLDDILQALAHERARAELLRRKFADAVRYPLFVLLGAASVLTFFMTFVLPKFSAVLHDFGAKIDPIADAFFQLSDFLVAHGNLIAVAATLALAAGVLLLRRPAQRRRLLSTVLKAPVLRTIATFHRAALFCRNLDVLLKASVPLTASLRILAEMMSTMTDFEVWTRVVERVRQGGKLAEALAETQLLPAMAVRMLRLGEESGQLPVLAGRVAEFYESKLQRSLDRFVGLIGPLAIVVISIVVGGLIISVMTSLLSLNDLVG